MTTRPKYKVGILATHPIQYHTPWYQSLAKHLELDLKVFYCHNPKPKEQGEAGFGVPFEWDIPLLDGYKYQFLTNKARQPCTSNFAGCDTPEIADIIKAEKFDTFIVHGWYNKSYWQAIKMCWRCGVPLLVRGDSQLMTARSWSKRLLKTAFYHWFIPKFSAYLAVGKRAREYYLAYGAESKKIFFAPHAVDNDFFAMNHAALLTKRLELRSGWGISEQAYTFLFVGKLIAKKRPHDFLEAIRLLSAKNKNIVGLIVGDGPLRQELEEYVRTFAIPVHFTGFLNQTELPKAYAVSDLLVLPSDAGETWGLVVNEAMASGLPAIVSDQVGCAPDLVYPGETGAIFPCGDVVKLSNTLLDFVTNPTLARTMKKDVLCIIDRYSISAAVEGTIAALRYIANSDKLL